MSNGPREQNVVRIISLFYLAMALVGLGLIAWRREAFDWDPIAPPGETWAIALSVTVGLIAAVHWLSRVAHAKIPSLRKGARDIQRVLGNLSPMQVAAVALASGLGEEILFRGWLMHETGLWISSIIFGLVHFPPNRQWLYWPFFAAAMGLILGWLYLWSGSLLFPILLHAGINFFNIRMLLPPGSVREYP